MPSQGELLDAVATIAIVVATHLRATRHRRDMSARCTQELEELRGEFERLVDRFNRWTGLP